MRLFFAILAVFVASYALADEKRYGSFILNTEIPNTLFFFDEIRQNDSFELRKALRNHDIENIVLASPGGNVFEGLQMAGIIFDKQLRTYIPRNTVCASACSYLFFAGKERLADGDLGVHQAASANSQDKQAIGETQYVTQFTVSEIIGFLNEFGTPAFVFERMFQDLEMYYFDPIELMELNTSDFNLEINEKVAIARYVFERIDRKHKTEHDQVEAPKEDQLSEKELIALIQQKLNDVGCNAGLVDGIWGRKTNSAAVKFAKRAGLPVTPEELISEQFIDALSKAKAGHCPKPKPQPKKIGPKTFAKYYKVFCDGLDVDMLVEVSNVNLKLQKFVYSTEGIPVWLFWDGNRLDDRVNMMRDGRVLFDKNGFVYRFEYSSVEAKPVCRRLVYEAIK